MNGHEIQGLKRTLLNCSSENFWRIFVFCESSLKKSQSLSSQLCFKAACKRAQQLPTLFRQQCWQLLRACWQWCANGCTNSQQVWELQCIVGRIQPTSLCNPYVMSVHSTSTLFKFGNITKDTLGLACS